MENEGISIGIINEMEGQWIYCCRCDKEDAMVPQGPRQWQCIQCGLRIIAQRIERDMFQCDPPDLTSEEAQRHIAFCARLAGKKIREMTKPHSPRAPRAIPVRMRIVFFVARILSRLLGIKAVQSRVINIKGGPNEKNQG